MRFEKGEFRMQLKKEIMTSILLSVIGSAVFGTAVVQASEPTEKFELEKIIVEGKRDVLPGGFVSKNGTIGILGDKDVLKTPFTVTNLTEKTIDTFGDPTQPLDSILANSPSIRQSGSILHNDFTFRGFRANGTSCYVNGIPGIWTQFNAPTFVAENIEVIAGPNSGISGTGTQYESDTAGGIVNFVTKKATEEPINRYTQTFSGKGLFGEYLDIGRRFGKNKEWGVRINTEALNGETAIDGEKVSAKSIFIDVDHRDAKSTTNLFAGYRDIDITNGQRWFKLGSKVTSLPTVPDTSKNYSFDGMEKGSYGYVATLNHEQRLNKDWKVFLNAGMLDNKLNKNVMYQNSAITINDDLGNFDIKTQSTTTPQKAYYVQTGFTGEIQTGAVKNTVTVAIDKAWRNRDAAQNVKTYTIGTGNIYSGLYQSTAVDSSYASALSNKTTIWGYSIVDSIDYKKMNILLGIHKHNASVNSFNTSTGSLTSKVESDATCPTYAISYNPIEEVSFYASHSESFDVGTVVGSTYKNAGDILAPAKTKQNEIGVKYLNKGLLTTLSFFDIKQANNIDVTKGDDTYYEQDGTIRHRGVELAINGKIAKKWSAMGGVSYLDAKYLDTAGNKYDGIQESGRPKWSAVAALEYAANEKLSIIGRAIYTGRSPVVYEKFWAPSYVTFDLGVNYKTKIMGRQAKVGVMCYNLLNKEYWQIARGDNLYLSTPRTIALTMAFDF